jgi:hypothetical protein
MKSALGSARTESLRFHHLSALSHSCIVPRETRVPIPWVAKKAVKVIKVNI